MLVSCYIKYCNVYDFSFGVVFFGYYDNVPLDGTGADCSGLAVEQTACSCSFCKCQGMEINKSFGKFYCFFSLAEIPTQADIA